MADVSSASPIGLPDDLSRVEDAGAVVALLSLLGVRDLCHLAQASHRHQGQDRGPAEAAWRQNCESCWRSKSRRYQLTPENLKVLTTTSREISWREHYKRRYLDGRRKELRPEELSSLQWAFNFAPHAGGYGCFTQQIVKFQASEPGSPQGQLFLAGYPPLPYDLSSNGKVLYIANFPPHLIRRLDTWEWEIANANVTFESCVGDGTQHDEPGFKRPDGDAMSWLVERDLRRFVPRIFADRPSRGFEHEGAIWDD